MKKIIICFFTAAFLITINLFSGCKGLNTISNKYEDEINKAIEESKEFIVLKDYDNAIKTLDSVIEKDSEGKIKSLREKMLKEYKDKTLKDAYSLIMKYDYQGASLLLNDLYPYLSEEDEELKKLNTTCNDFKELVPYEGPVEHIFFHPLIAYPKLTFDGDYMADGFDKYFVTVPEFKNVIEQLYRRGYILIDIKLLYSTDENGNMIRNKLMLPKDKKPFIISMDDYNFLKYMRINGCVHGLALDEKGNVVTYTDSKDGKRTYSDDNEIVPILDRFVKKYPDFSFGGAKGVIALNGYEGALGFPTDDVNSPEYNKTLEEARAVANRLKETGWQFACHSYSHYSPKKKTLEQFKYDVDKWIEEVTPVVGSTEIYIYPFGEQIKANDPKFKYMLDRGYKIFCGVGSRPYLKFYDKYAVQMRRNIDGIAFRDNRLSDILDVTNILDSVRPNRDEK